MQYRTSRGIQYEDVAQAADALLQEGSRPTIERIRLRLGRGSPNTVSPMLEQWFGGLGQRLGGGAYPMSASPENAVPAPVMQAAQALWAAASSAADADAAQAWAARQVEQDAASQELQITRTQLQARELALDERRQAMETALALSTQQLRESNERAKIQQAALAQREQELRDVRNALSAAAQRSSEMAAVLQQQLEQVQAQAHDERSAIEARHVANERRWLEEVDRARQEARKSALLAQEEAKKNALLQTQAELAADTTASTLQTLRQELTSAQGQAAQAQALLSDLQAQTALVRPAPLPARQLRVTSSVARTPLRRKLGRPRP